MNKNIKRTITFSMLISMLLANKVKAEDLGVVKVSRNSNPISNGFVACSTTSQDDFWNDFLNYDYYGNNKTTPTVKPQQTPRPTPQVTQAPSVSDNLVDGFNQADRSVISYFSNAKEMLNGYLDSSDYTNLKAKAKSLVITGIDFLFYDGTIKGFTRKELTEKGKEYIMEYIADTLYELDYYFPGMSDTILEKYGTAKEYLKSKFSNILGYVRDWMGEDYYNMFGEEFGDLFEDFGDIGGVIGSLFDDKYQQWKLK